MPKMGLCLWNSLNYQICEYYALINHSPVTYILNWEATEDQAHRLWVRVGIV